MDLTNDALYCIILHVHEPLSFLRCSLVCKRWSFVCRKLRMIKAKEFCKHVTQTFNQTITKYSYLPNSHLHGEYIMLKMDPTMKFIIETRKSAYSFGTIVRKHILKKYKQIMLIIKWNLYTLTLIQEHMQVFQFSNKQTSTKK